MEQDIVGAEDHVLYHHVLVSLEHGIWRQVGRIDLHHLLPVEGNPVRFAVFRPGLRLTPFLFREWSLGGGCGVLALIAGAPCSPLSRLSSSRKRWFSA